MTASLLALVLGLALASPAPAAVQTYTFREPIEVAGYEVKQEFTLAERPHVDGHITRMEVDIVDAAGAPVPIQRLMLHHIVFLNLARPDNTCEDFDGFDSRPMNESRERFYAAGEERAKLFLPDGYGYPIGANEAWGMLYMVMNHRQTPDEAFIQYTVTVSSGPEDAGTIDVTPYWLDVRNCRADPIYNVPGTGSRKSTDVRRMSFRMPRSGRIVGGAGHVHGGARKLVLAKPDCARQRPRRSSRRRGPLEVAASVPTWGLRKHPFYNVRPILHEPGPINMSAFLTPTGIPVKAGERIQLRSLYEDSRPHTRVMGIMIIFVAHDREVARKCARAPRDLVNVRGSVRGRRGPVPFTVPLTGIDRSTGRAVTIRRPPGAVRRLGRRASIRVEDRLFSVPNAIVSPGTRVNWLFFGTELHNVTLANGPVGIGSPNLNVDPDGSARRFTFRFRKPGTYRFFCALHPVQMQESIVVRGRR